jgi:predicted aspartyl protease
MMMMTMMMMMVMMMIMAVAMMTMMMKFVASGLFVISVHSHGQTLSAHSHIAAHDVQAKAACGQAFQHGSNQGLPQGLGPR